MQVEWIRCKEQMPPRHKTVWVQLAYLGTIAIGKWIGGLWDKHWNILDRPGTYSLKAVAYWARIVWPEPPGRDETTNAQD